MSAVLPSSSSLNEPVSPGDVMAVAVNNPKPVTVVTAVERLERSRDCLRAAMLPRPPRAHAGYVGHSGAGVGAVVSRIVERIKEMPVVSVVLDTVQSWWDRHPLHTASIVGTEATRKFVAPVADRHPLLLMLGALLFGAVFALTRPWRWILRSALFAGLLPALATRAIRELPFDALARMYSSFGNAAKPPPVPTPSPVRATPSDSIATPVRAPTPAPKRTEMPAVHS